MCVTNSDKKCHNVGLAGCNRRNSELSDGAVCRTLGATTVRRVIPFMIAFGLASIGGDTGKCFNNNGEFVGLTTSWAFEIKIGGEVSHGKFPFQLRAAPSTALHRRLRVSTGGLSWELARR